MKKRKYATGGGAAIAALVAYTMPLSDAQIPAASAGEPSTTPDSGQATTAPVSATYSTLTAPSAARTDSYVVVKVMPKGQHGQALGSGHKVVISDASGNSQTATWNSQGKYYEAKFREKKAGTYNFTATVDGTQVGSVASVKVAPGLVQSNETTVTAPKTVQQEQPLLVLVQPKDGNGNPLGSGQTVVVDNGAGDTVAATWDSKGQDYVAKFTELKAGTYTFTATVNHVVCQETAQTTVVAHLLADASTVRGPSLVSADSSKIVISVVPWQGDGDGDADESPLGPHHTVTVSDSSGQTKTAVWNDANQDYEATFYKTKVGEYTFHATADGTNLTQTVTTKVIAGKFNTSLSQVTAPKMVTSDGSITVHVLPQDAYGNSMLTGHTVQIVDSDGQTQTAAWNSTNQDYEATFHDKTTGLYIFHATVDGNAVTETATTDVTPGLFSTSNSTVTAPKTVTTDDTITVQVQPEDDNGNKMGSGHTVTVSDGSGNTVTAAWSDTNQDYEATFTEHATGTYTFSSIVDGKAIQQTATTLVTPGAVGATTSTLTAPTSATTDDTITVKAVPEDKYGNPLGMGHTVIVTDGAGQTTTATWNSTNQDYEAVFSETTTGTYTFSSTADGTAITQTATTDVLPGVVNAGTSGMTAPTTATTDDNIVVDVVPEDAHGNLLGSGHAVTVTDGNGQTATATWNTTYQDYEATFREKTVGSYTFHSTVDGTPVTETATTNVTPGAVNIVNSGISAPATAVAGNNIVVKVTPEDSYGNPLGTDGKVIVTDGAGQSKTATWNSTNNDYEATFTETKAGNYTFTSTVDSKVINATATTNVTPAALSASTSTVTAPKTQSADKGVLVQVVPKDGYGNPLGSGLTITVTDNAGQTQTAVWNPTNQDYETTFTEHTTGTYTFTSAVGPKGNTTALTGKATTEITPGAVGAQKSTVVSVPSTTQVDNPITVDVTPKDSYGNPVGYGQTVDVSDGTNTKTATWNPTNRDYEATFSYTKSGPETFSASDDNLSLTQTATTQVNPGALYDGNSTVTAPSTATTDDTITVDVSPEDSYGNLLGSGHTVSVSDGDGHTAAATWNKTNQDYEAQFNETTTGTYTFSATVDKSGLSDTAVTDVTPGALDTGTSTVTAPATATTDNPVTVHVSPEDAHGNLLGSGHTVTITDGAGKTVTATWNSGNQDYEGQFAETTPATYTFTATVDKTVLTKTAKTQVNPGALYDSNSTVTAPSTATTDDTITVDVNPEDSHGNSIGSGHTVKVSDGDGHTASATWNSANQDYEAQFNETVTGAYTFGATVDATALSSTAKTQVTAGALYDSNSTVTAPSTATTDDTITVAVNPEDDHGNSIGSGHTVSVSDGSGHTATATWNSTNQDYEAQFNETTTGSYTFSAKVDGSQLTATATTKVTAGAPNATNSTVSSPTEVQAGSNNVPVQVALYDDHGNAIGQLPAGESLSVSDGTTKVTAVWNSTDKAYVATFSEESVGTITFTPTVSLSGGGTVTLNTTKTIVDPNAGNSTITATPTTAAAADNNVLVKVNLEDGSGNSVGSGQTVSVTDGTNTVPATWNAGNSDYEATFSETTPGSVTFTATDGKMTLTSSKVTITAGALNASKTTFTLPSYALIGSAFTVGVKPEDAFGNAITPTTDPSATITLSDGSTTKTATWNSSTGEWEAQFTESAAGSKTFTAADGSNTATSTALNVQSPGVVDAAKSTITGPGTGVAPSGSAFTISVVPEDAYGNKFTDSSATVSISDGTTTKTATYNATNKDFEASFTETAIQTDAFVATVHDKRTNGDTVLNENPALVQIQPSNANSPVTPTVTGGSGTQTVNLTSPSLAVKLPDYGNGNTSVGTTPTTSSTGDVPFWYFPEFPATSITNFNQAAVASGGHADMLWFSYKNSSSTYTGGAGTPNGDSFFEYTFYVPKAETVSYKLNYGGSPDDVALAWMDNQPMAYNQDISAYSSGWTSVGVSMPAATGTISLSAGPHTLVVEAANAFTPGSGNNAGFGMTMTGQTSGTTYVTTSSSSGWKTTGYVVTAPTFWYPDGTTRTITEEYLDPNTLTVSITKQWKVISN